MNNRVRWRLGALASAIALLGSLASFEAQALALGRITVQSALGEPLRAEIDIADINAEEAASLKAGTASAETFRAAGLEYTAAIVDLQVSLQRRADGRAFLRLSSARPVNEPFVDLILEANWSSGRIVRDYTMLFDPLPLRRGGNAGSSVAAVPMAPTAPALSSPPAPQVTLNRSSPPQIATPAPMRPAPAAAPVARAAGSSPAAKPITGGSPTGTGQQLTVKAGDTAGKIAAQNRPVSISLDQMLVALLRSNPDAFIGGNINRIKAGAVLDLPGAEQASAITPAEASRTIFAQAKDFNDFRRKFAESVPSAQVTAANRQATGQIQAKVDDRAPAATTPDKLTLSKGTVQGKPAAEEKIARDRQASEASTRVAELSKNISDLNKIAGVPAATAAIPASSVPKGSIAPPTIQAAPVANAATQVATAVIPAIAVSPPVIVAAPASSPAATPTSTPASSSPIATGTATSTTAAIAPVPSPATLATAPTATTTATDTATDTAATMATAASGPAAVLTPAPLVVKKPAAQPPTPEPSLIDEITENPLTLPGLAALLLLLGGFAFYRFRQRGNSVPVDSSFLESRLQPDSFFGASGGQRIDTSEGGATGSSLVYSPSQLDAAGDVDPVAEADVYLAYGRDLQAEEILKEAIRTTPNRVAIHSKLMEIYAKRRDLKAFEVISMSAFKLTKGEGPDWAYIGEMGRELDPSNQLYQPGGHPSSRSSEPSAPVVAAAFGASTLPQMIQPIREEATSPVDFDLDLDFSLGDEPVDAPAQAIAPAPEPTVAMKPVSEPVFDGLEMDFDIDKVGAIGTVAVKPPVQAVRAATPEPISFDLSDTDSSLADNSLTFSIDPPASPVVKPGTQKAPAVMDSGMLEFDLGSLSLELDEPSTEGAGIQPEFQDDQLETKFFLAEEFRALGDMDGARSLAEEVLAGASGSLKNKAQAFLNALS
jgi:pilus assembly protein FimV